MKNINKIKKNFCKCDYPLIRTSDKRGYYCGICGLDINDNVMTKREILEQAFKEIFKDDWANELRDFEHGFSDFYDATMRAMELVSERHQPENQQQKTDTEQLNIAGVMQWVFVKDGLPKNDKQVLVQWSSGRFGINEYWESDNEWKYNFNKTEVVAWCEITAPIA